MTLMPGRTGAMVMRVPKFVLKILVDSVFAVRAGQTLIELDPADYKVAVDRAKGGARRG